MLDTVWIEEQTWLETREAIKEFETFVERYPNSSLMGEVREKLRAARDRLASASYDRTVRVWDPNADLPLIKIPVYSAATSLACVDDTLVIGMANGLLALRISDLPDVN